MTKLSSRLFSALLSCMALAAPWAYAEGDIAWRHQVTQEAVTLTANPLGRDSRTAFYLGRGFTGAAIQPYAEACGFSFGMQNNGTSALSTRLADWHAIGADGKRTTLRLPELWDAAWEKAGVPQAARIAFHWAQFQAENVFEPGDWIMGMATLEQPLVGTFRIVARYRDNKGDHEIVLDRLACARD